MTVDLDVGRSCGSATRRAALATAWEAAVGAFVGDDPGRSVVLAGDGCVVGGAADVVRPGASVLKLFIATAAHLHAAAGGLDLHETVSVAELPGSVNPSVLESLSPEHRFSLAELTRLALATSDNRIAEHLVLLLGTERITAYAATLGCSNTQLRVGFADEMLSPLGRANVTTANDCMVVLDALRHEPVLAPLRPALRSSLFNSRILSLLPHEVVVSHKTGSLNGVANDVGVLHAPSGDLTACFLSDGQADPARTSIDIGTCARAAFDAWEGCTR